MYRYYAADGSLLYVGIAFDPEARGRQHARTASDTWWKLATTRTDEWFESRQGAEQAELDAIVDERPRFNVRDNPRLTDDIRKVRQLRSVRADRLPIVGSGKNYVRVAELLRGLIESGELPPGTKVSRPTYAAQFGVSTDTVKRACDVLAKEGLLQRGHGHRVPSEPQPEDGRFQLPLDRPDEIADFLCEAMGNDQMAALMAALVAASWRKNPVVA